MVSHHPPAMALMGVPWGPLQSWPAAGNCFVTLSAVISLLAAICLYLSLRIGVKPLYLVIACVCAGISLGPYPPSASAHVAATAFMADSLFAWATLVAVLLVPYEGRVQSETMRGSVFRGLLWGLSMSVGTMAKLSFLYFVVLIVPTLFLMKLHRDGLRNAVSALGAFVFCSSPLILYLLRWGRYSFFLAKSSSFGGMAPFYYSPLAQFLGRTVRESPGMAISLVLTVAGLLYLMIRGRLRESWPAVLAIAIVVGFGFIVLASPNREIRFSFPLIIAMPFLVAVAISGRERSISGRESLVCAALVFSGLFAAGIPTRYRPQWRSLSRSNAVFAEADRLNARSIVLATDSPTLNGQLMMVAGLYTSRPTIVGSLAYSDMNGAPIQDDFRVMSLADLVVFQDKAALNPPFTNQRAMEYERYVRQIGLGPIRVAGDVSVYLMHYQPADRR